MILPLFAFAVITYPIAIYSLVEDATRLDVVLLSVLYQVVVGKVYVATVSLIALGDLIYFNAVQRENI